MKSGSVATVQTVPWKAFLKQRKILLVLILLFIVFSFLAPGFCSIRNVENMLLQTSAYGVTACAMMFLIIVGQIDIGVGSTMAIASIIAVAIINATGSILLGIVAALAAGGAIGFINGLVMTRLRIDSFIATLAAMTFLRGLAYVVTSGEITCANPGFHSIALGSALGITNIVGYFLIAVILAELVLRFTTYGRNVCATGGNREVARYTGIRTNFYIVSAFVLTSVAAAFSGVLLAARLNAASPSYGTDAALQCISAIVLGGTSLSGGSGGALKTFVGLMILTIVSNALNLLNVYAHYQTLIEGLLLVVIVVSDRFYEKRIK